MQSTLKKGFTLIELLIVIAIVAILAAVVILTLNPAELLRQSRDSNRISDMGTLKTAVNLYLTDAASPALTPVGAGSKCFYSAAATTAAGDSNPSLATANGCGGFFGSVLAANKNASTSKAVDGTGWVPVPLTAISSGAPVGNLPVDPVNNPAQNLVYAYTSTSTGGLSFEVAALLESNKYASSTNKVVGNSGSTGVSAGGGYYQGTTPGMNL